MDGDGNTDIILRHDVDYSSSDGMNAIWYLNGAQFDSGVLIENNSGVVVLNVDQDWEIAGAGDFDQDTHPDLIWRHRTLGANLYWLMNSSTELSHPFLTPHVFDTDWRMETQSWPDSTWRLDQASTSSGVSYLKVHVGADGSSFVLNWRFSIRDQQATGTSLKRRLLPTGAWNTLVTGLGFADSHTDATSSVGERYEYKVVQTDSSGNEVATHIDLATPQLVVAAIKARELFQGHRPAAGRSDRGAKPEHRAGPIGPRSGRGWVEMAALRCAPS